MTNPLPVVAYADGFYSADDYWIKHYYDREGRYIGQEQLNVIDPEGPDHFFFKATAEQAERLRLTEAQMKDATK